MDIILFLLIACFIVLIGIYKQLEQIKNYLRDWHNVENYDERKKSQEESIMRSIK